ncbi:unnamed protein product [Prorocentrum cordatum]|uniref:Uncharacterized protein n=1 Tax=Prorocentrum cordatum TaxID=2364126 RepID=A0ABN9UA13_9DINO|nr:unnamed protein product [Polarella glacialis]
MSVALLLILSAPLAHAVGLSVRSETDRSVAARARVEALAASAEAMQYFRRLESASARRPVLVPPGDVRRAEVSRPSGERRSSLLGLDASRAHRVTAEFQPSAEFQAEGGTDASGRQSQGYSQGSELPWGVGSPRAGDSLPVAHYSAMPFIDFPKEIEYSLETGDNVQSFSSASQDIKLITQVLENITNGFYLDSNGADGEKNSNTLLLELTGWRGLILEPRVYEFVNLWGKFRKAWLFLGAMSPNENATKIGFAQDGTIDMLSGHKIHAYALPRFMEEMGGRRSIDFWSLSTGGYEAEVLNETLLHSGKNIEIGVILVKFDGRRTGRGDQSFVQARSKDDTEELVFEILHNASFQYIGGLDAYWINHVEPRFHYKDAVFVNPSYFQARGIPTPQSVKAAPPPPLGHPLNDQDWPGFSTWDSGYSADEEVERIVAYMEKAKRDATASEPAPKAHRVEVTRLVEFQ